MWLATAEVSKTSYRPRDRQEFRDDLTMLGTLSLILLSMFDNIDGESERDKENDY